MSETPKRMLAHHEEGAHRHHARLERDHPGQRELGVGVVGGRQRHAQQDQPGRGQGDAPPLARTDAVAEQPLGHHGKEHDPPGEHRLHHRHRRHGQGGDMQAPCGHGDGHADREPLGPEEADGRAPRMGHGHGLCGVRPPVLVEEAQVGGEGASQREEDADL
jgi:hypothetical protein